jgi:hypothetical protein
MEVELKKKGEKHSWRRNSSERKRRKSCAGKTRQWKDKVSELQEK